MKQLPPIDETLLSFKFPEIRKKVYENGLTLIVIERHDIPKVYLRMGFSFGEKHDPEDKRGAVEMIARLLKKGTHKHSYHEISKQIDFVGGVLDASSTNDFFYVYGQFLRDFFPIGMELMSEILLQPTFTLEELEKERQKILSDLENEKSSPGFLAHKQMDQILYGPHPYGFYKSAESVSKIDPKILHHIHQTYMIPSNAFLVIAGDITFETASQSVEDYLSSWTASPSPLMKLPQPTPLTQRNLYLIDRPGSAQANLLLGNQLFSRLHPDYIKALTANKILGEGGSSRLFMSLREKKGYTYGAYSSLDVAQDTGGWVANAEVRSEVVDKAIEAFFEEFQRIKTEQVSEAELKNAKRYLMGVFPLKNETSATVAGLRLWQALYDFPASYWNEYLETINSVTREDVQQISQHLKEDLMSIVVVGDAETLVPKLSQFGDIKIFDKEGNLKT